MSDEQIELALRLYNDGYHAGHHDTVEGRFSDDTKGADAEYYHGEAVSEILREDEEAKDGAVVNDNGNMAYDIFIALEKERTHRHEVTEKMQNNCPHLARTAGDVETGYTAALLDVRLLLAARAPATWAKILAITEKDGAK